MRLGEAILYLTSDNSKLNSGLGDAEEQVKQSGGRLNGFLTGIAQGAGQMAFGLVQNAAQVAVGAVKESIDLASDLNESANKVKVVFGEQSDAILKFAESSDTALGQSKLQALDALGTFGNLFVSMGMGGKESADLSMNLVTLASDLASFNNVDPAVALDKLRAGLLGEAEPLRTLGVNLSASAVQAKALSMGLVQADVDMTKVNGATLDLEQAQAKAAAALKKSGESSLEYRQAQQSVAEAEDKLKRAMEGSNVELTAAQKAQASYAIIMEQTKTAQGDFANTSDGLANQQRIQAAQWENLKTKIGVGLLPIQMELTTQMGRLAQVVMPPLVDILINRVIPAIQGLIDWFKSLSPEQQKFTLGIGAVTVALIALLPILGTIGAAIAAINLPMLAIAGVVALLAVAWAKDWGGIQEKTQAVGAFIGAAFDGLKWSVGVVWQSIKDFWAWVTSIATGTMPLAISAPEWILLLVAWTWPALAPVEWIVALMAWLWPEFISQPAWVKALMDWLWPKMGDQPSWVQRLVQWAWPQFPGQPAWLQSLLNWVWPKLPSLPTWLGGSGSQNAEGSSVPSRVQRSLLGSGRGLTPALAGAGRGGGQRNIYITVNATLGNQMDVLKLGRRLANAIEATERY